MAVRQVLVIGPRWVGDMVMAQALFAALKARDPDCAIDVVAPVWATPLLDRMPEVRTRIDAPFKPKEFGLSARWRLGRALAGRYDAAYVLPGSWKSALVPFFARVPVRIGYRKEMRYGLLTRMPALPKALKRKTAETYFRLAEVVGPRPDPKLAVDPLNRDRLLSTHELALDGYVAFMPGAEYGPAKRWPARHYAALARAFMARGDRVILLGSPKDRPVGAEIADLAPGVIDLTGETRLEDAIDLLSGARLAVSNDSGLMHVAAAVGTAVVAVYGSTSAENTPPLAPRAEIVTLKLPCSPCHQKVCPLGHLDCLEKLEPALVLAAAARVTGEATR
ncbi:MAG: lipopolysaccharide heptosyltransferase II [Phyllobacteriaceae bacterium]|nr:lipopolysaccharide heptosyltransferase II [Phyllobacteriaceae bacterium]